MTSFPGARKPGHSGLFFEWETVGNRDIQDCFLNALWPIAGQKQFRFGGFVGARPPLSDMRILLTSIVVAVNGIGKKNMANRCRLIDND
jgi:hypothetical protein